jgi:DNA repair photolyase
MPRPSWNPPNPWLSRSVELDEPAGATLEVREEDAKSALSRNESPDLPFRWSLNPYRGCQHACAYCYARPTHQYLGFGAGTDFDRRLVVKRNLPERLERELASPRWKGEPVTFSGVTDPYQPLEARYELTRRCLEVCDTHATPVVIVTKGVLVRRDADLLARLAAGPGARVFVSIPFADADIARKLEPGAPSPAERLATLAELARAGVPTGLALAPLVPGLGEEGLSGLVAGAARAGARYAFSVLLRLPAEVLPVFRKRLEEALPERAAPVLGALSEMRAGNLQEARFGRRMGGEGVRYRLLRELVTLLFKKNGLTSGGDEGLENARLRARPRQGLLFDAGAE